MDTSSFRFNVNMGTASPAPSHGSSHLNIDYAFFAYFLSITAPASGKKNSGWSAGGNCISSAKVVGFQVGLLVCVWYEGIIVALIFFRLMLQFTTVG